VLQVVVRYALLPERGAGIGKNHAARLTYFSLPKVACHARIVPIGTKLLYRYRTR
jgi:hypothetical protein